MGKWITVEQGTIDIVPRYPADSIREHILPNTFPRRYWDMVYVEDGEVCHAGVTVHIDELARPRTHQCARCPRIIQPQYTHCFRCHNYIETKKRIQAA